MSNIKRYKVEDTWKDWSVFLEVNHDILTPERATMINEFLSDSRYRLDEERGEVVRVVIRMAGSWMINHILREDGADFTEHSKNFGFGSPGPLWTDDLHNDEGWGGKGENEMYGWCGIRVIAACAQGTSFDDVQLTMLPDE